MDHTIDFNVRDLLILSSIRGIGPNRLRAIVSHFGNTNAISKASSRQLCSIEGIERKLAQTIVNFYRDSGPARAKRHVNEQLSRLNKVNGRIITFWDKEYPENLKKIYDAPPFLFVRGKLDETDKYSIAIVGTRAPTQSGVQLAEKFASGLSQFGIPTVSGLARGIDTIAHQATLKNGGRTVAVIGSGIDIIYPPENKQLAEHIIEQGAIVSEFEMGTTPDPGNFPRRNRIISGIALATLIVETGIDGGAMITATTALDQNRDVFAIPSAVTEKRKSGTNLLIKEGKASLTETVEDIISELAPRLKRILKNQETQRTPPPPDLTLFEHQVYDAMGDEPIHIDALADRSSLPTSDALVQLLSLEFKGVVKQMPGKNFVKT